jgi:hypothetical protein
MTSLYLTLQIEIQLCQDQDPNRSTSNHVGLHQTQKYHHVDTNPRECGTEQ